MPLFEFRDSDNYVDATVDKGVLRFVIEAPDSKKTRGYELFAKMMDAFWDLTTYFITCLLLAWVRCKRALRPLLHAPGFFGT